MAKLSKQARKHLPPSAFAGPHDTYPVEDADHARAAILDAGVAYREGHISLAEKNTIDRKATAVLKRHPLHP